MFHSGMTIEVLGTVLATAIQGQIVGGTNDCPTEFNAAKSRNGSKFTVSTSSLEESVSVSPFFRLITMGPSVAGRVNWACLSTEKSLPDSFRGHLPHLRALHNSLVFGRERATRSDLVVIGSVG